MTIEKSKVRGKIREIDVEQQNKRAMMLLAIAYYMHKEMGLSVEELKEKLGVNFQIHLGCHVESWLDWHKKVDNIAVLTEVYHNLLKSPQKNM